jgi:hypothetical protein
LPRQDYSRKRGHSYVSVNSRKRVKLFPQEDVGYYGFTAEQHSIVVRAASAFQIPQDSLAAAIVNLQSSCRNRPTILHKAKQQRAPSDEILLLSCQSEECDPMGRSYQNNGLKYPAHGLVGLEGPIFRQEEILDDQDKTESNDCRTENCFGFNLALPWSEFFANMCPWEPSSGYEHGKSMF